MPTFTFTAALMRDTATPWGALAVTIKDPNGGTTVMSWSGVYATPHDREAALIDTITHNWRVGSPHGGRVLFTNDLVEVWEIDFDRPAWNG